MKKYRKKPLIIEAIQYTCENFEEILDFIAKGGGNVSYTRKKIIDDNLPCYINLSVVTREGEMRVNETDWIIKGINGEFYPCKDDIFKKTYEEVN